MTIRPWVPLGLNNSSKVVDDIIVSYLPRSDVVNFCCFCGSLFEAHNRFVDEDRQCRQEGYTPELVDLFTQYSYSLLRVPTLDQSSITAETYISCKDMEGLAIARFKKEGRPAI